jgi:pimeloyl-ACP methyl ester carboxylesterase
VLRFAATGARRLGARSHGMPVFSELRYFLTRRAKLFTGILALLLFWIAASATIAGMLLYHILYVPRMLANLDTSLLPGQPVKVTFAVPERGVREGWFFPGARGGPTAIVCHGYQSQRADVLTLVTALQEHQFNVFTFDFTGHGSSPGVTTLGYHEAGELLAAIQALAKRDDVDPKRFGIWGTDMGAYAALSAAISDPRIALVVADSAYDDPRDLVRLELDRSGLEWLPLVRRFAVLGFEQFNRGFRHQRPLIAGLGRLKGVSKLFIESSDNPVLAASTRSLFAHAPDPRQQLEEKASYADMASDERRAYESAIVNFFLQNLPPTAATAR